MDMTTSLATGSAPTIEATGLVKRFGRTVALDGLDLIAEPGQVVAVLGPNCADKTTFVRAIASCSGRTAALSAWLVTTSLQSRAWSGG